MVLKKSHRAIQDMDEIWLYVARKANPQSADRIIGIRVHFMGMIADHPLIGRTRDELRLGLRSLPVDKYLIFYTCRLSEIEIVRVLHGSRDIAALFKQENE